MYVLNLLKSIIPKKLKAKRTGNLAVACVFLFSIVSFNLFFMDTPKAKAATKVDDASDFGFLGGARHVVRTTGGTIYVAVEDSGDCEIWSSSDGSSWTEQDAGDSPTCLSGIGVGGMAIDSSNDLHLLVVDVSGHIRHVVFDTPTNQFVLNDDFDEIGCVIDGGFPMDIAVNAGVVHAVYTCTEQMINFNTDMRYANTSLGSMEFKATIATVQDSNDDVFGRASISFDQDGLPIVGYSDLTLLYIAIGDDPAATSFIVENTGFTVQAVSPTSLVTDFNGNAWLSYTNSSGDISVAFHDPLQTWQNWSNVSPTSTAGEFGSLVTDGTDIYLFYRNGSNDIAYNLYDGAWNSETVLETGTYPQVIAEWSYSANHAADNQIDYLFSDGTDVFWNKLSLGAPNSAPAAPTLTAPSSGATGVSTVPQFQMRTTDTDNDYLRYEIVVYQSDCSTVVRTIDQTASQTGWTGQDSQFSTAYVGNSSINSSTMAVHNYQPSALSHSTTYCWKARAKDPGGSDTWSAYSSTQSFTTTAAGASPSAPTLINPVDGIVRVRGFPIFELRASDANNDYLQYKIEICSTSNCSVVVRTIDQSISQSGWVNQNQNGNTAYTGSSTITGSTIGVHTLQTTGLSANTQYWWRGYAIDPGGSNVFSSASAINTFTVSPVIDINVRGGANLRGGSKVN